MIPWQLGHKLYCISKKLQEIRNFHIEHFPYVACTVNREISKISTVQLIGPLTTEGLMNAYICLRIFASTQSFIVHKLKEDPLESTGLTTNENTEALTLVEKSTS